MQEQLPEDLTVKQIREFRRILNQKLFFEPVADPGFRRPVAKLQGFIEETVAFTARLDSVIAILEERKAQFEGRKQAIGAHDAFFEALRSVTLEKPVRLEAAVLSTNATRVQIELNENEKKIFAFEKEVMMFWLVLERMASLISVGTKEVYPGEFPTEGMKELLTEGLETFVEKKTELAIGPVFLVYKAMYDWIRRDEKCREKLDETMETADRNDLLAYYFSWWTEGEGKETIETAVANCESAAATYEGLVDSAFKLTSTMLDQIGTFREKTASLIPNPKTQPLAPGT
jgi:hypothetical protein